MTAQSIALMVVAGLFLLAVQEIPFMPRCPFCGKTKEHARDCSTQK